MQEGGREGGTMFACCGCATPCKWLASVSCVHSHLRLAPFRCLSHEVEETHVCRVFSSNPVGFLPYASWHLL